MNAESSKIAAHAPNGFPKPSEIQPLEYEALRQELLQNKQYVLERPLLIIGAAGVAAMQLPESAPALALPALLISVLCVNLWFTANRLRSSARIIGYIAAIIEPGSQFPWIGWENALRLQRHWTKNTPADRIAENIARFQEHGAAIPDAMRFYPMVMALHVVPVVFAVIASLIVTVEKSDWVKISMLVVTISATACFVYLAFFRYRLGEMTRLIEDQRAIWMAVFTDRTTSGK
jgi:hypothetical protein